MHMELVYRLFIILMTSIYHFVTAFFFLHVGAHIFFANCIIYHLWVNKLTLYDTNQSTELSSGSVHILNWY